MVSAARDSGVIAGGGGGGALDSEQDVVTSSMQHDDERQTPLGRPARWQSVRPAVNAKWSAVRPRVTPRRRAVGRARATRCLQTSRSTRRLSKHAAD